MASLFCANTLFQGSYIYSTYVDKVVLIKRDGLIVENSQCSVINFSVFILDHTSSRTSKQIYIYRIIFIEEFFPGVARGVKVSFKKIILIFNPWAYTLGRKQVFTWNRAISISIFAVV